MKVRRTESVGPMTTTREDPAAFAPLSHHRSGRIGALARHRAPCPTASMGAERLKWGKAVQGVRWTDGDRIQVHIVRGARIPARQDRRHFGRGLGHGWGWNG